MQSVITAELGYLLKYNGSTLQGTELVYSALEMALQHQNNHALGIIYNDLSICIADTAKKLEYEYKALIHAQIAGDHFTSAFILCNISDIYRKQQNKDSSLFYAQRGYELCLAKKLDPVLPYSLFILANVHYYLLNDKPIAYEYLKKAMNTKSGREITDNFLGNITGISNFFYYDNMKDSALYYADIASQRINDGSYYHSLAVYDIKKKVYETTNSDSALKYYKLYETTKENADMMSKSREQQILTIKKELELEKQDLDRKQSIQFALIAFGIITSIIIFLLLSRSFITNTKMIESLGVVALLIVFEFLNLLLHPFLERVTHHSPVLMLLALVCIAALLVPLHHKIEHWATTKMVEKNKEIRLARARKTLEQLDSKTEKS